MKQATLTLDTEQISREAGALLSVRGNRMRMVLASLVVLSTVVFYAMLSAAFDYAVRKLFGVLAGNPMGNMLASAVYLLLVAIATLFLTAPLVFGLLRMAYLISEERETVLSDLFFFFTSRSAYKRALRLSFGAVVRIFPACALMDLTYEWVQGISFVPYWTVAVTGVLILCELGLLLLSFLVRFYAAYLLCTEGTPDHNAAQYVFQNVSRQYGFHVGLGHFLEHLPSILLSIATMGILFLMDTLPKMMISYFCICRKSISLIIQTEE